MDMRIGKIVSPNGFMFEFLEDKRHIEVSQKENSLRTTGIRYFVYEVDNVDKMYEKINAAGYKTINHLCTSDDGGMYLFFDRDPEFMPIKN
jgi:hypothetical protein